ncbi:amidase [Thioclava atlantica]|uniref:Amidase n=1 Tax=Thioclava atlantica TaxID=1317124 RepID=A0A085TZY7_9RHOB|nr:amidase [Thioclava atlantica]KFE36284.1 amidase [Thioclava atlantica]
MNIVTATPHPRTALDTLRAFEAGDLTPERHLRDLLDLTARIEPDLRAWAHLDPDEALKSLAAAAPTGLMRGLPIGVKDVIAVAGMPLRCGSPIHADAIAASDAASVALARMAGAYVMGKTETTEFATYKPAPTQNPAAPGHTPGGSSSGSAATVAAGLVPLALGTQTAGSVIRPASYCGIVGYKPSFDLIDPSGTKTLARSFDTIGIFARAVADAALYVEAVTGLPLLDAARRADPPVTAGLCRSPAWEEAATPELHAAWDDLAARLRGKTTLREITLPAEYATAAQAHPRLMAREASQALAAEWRAHRGQLSAQLQAMLEQGREMEEREAVAIRAMIARLRQRFAQDLGGVDVLITPAAPGPAPAIETGTGSPVFNRLWTLLGAPCVSVPGLAGPDGRPIGMQLVGPMGADGKVLQAAGWLETILR